MGEEPGHSQLHYHLGASLEPTHQKPSKSKYDHRNYYNNSTVPPGYYEKRADMGIDLQIWLPFHTQDKELRKSESFTPRHLKRPYFGSKDIFRVRPCGASTLLGVPLRLLLDYFSVGETVGKGRVKNHVLPNPIDWRPASRGLAHISMRVNRNATEARSCRTDEHDKSSKSYQFFSPIVTPCEQ